LIENTYIADLAEQGRIEDALDYYREKRPEAFEKALAPQANLGRYATDLVNIAVLLKMLDPGSERADELLKLVEQRLQRGDGRSLPWLQSVLKATVAEARGRRDEALDLLEMAIDQGLTFAWTWRVEIPLVMRDLQRDPRFQILEAEIQARLARQHDEAITLLEAGP
jgi:tetratricopeptide (TPR) repeat protein